MTLYLSRSTNVSIKPRYSSLYFRFCNKSFDKMVASHRH